MIINIVYQTRIRRTMRHNIKKKSQGKKIQCDFNESFDDGKYERKTLNCSKSLTWVKRKAAKAGYFLNLY